MLMVSIAAFAQWNRNTAPGDTPQSECVKIDGALGKLDAVITKPVLKPGERCPMVILCHGFSGNKGGFFCDIASELLAAGVATLRFDFNGHGDSEGKFEDMTVLNEIEDARKVFEYARALPYVSDISLLGHSQGGVVASMLAGRLGCPAIKSEVLMAPAAVLKDDALRGSSLGMTYDPADPPEYIEMWGGRRLGRGYILTAQKLDIYGTAKAFTGPCRVIHGTADSVVPIAYGRRYADELPSAEVYFIEGEDHGFSKYTPAAVRAAVEFLTGNQ